MANDEEEKPAPLFFLFKNGETGIHYKAIKEWCKTEYFNGSRNVYQIILQKFDGSETVIEYFDDSVRDVEYENFLDKLREQGYILM